MLKLSNAIISEYNSPAGTIWLASVGDELMMCDWMKTAGVNGTSAIIETAKDQLNEYFSGIRRTFDIPIKMCGTDFQNSVWSELLNIPYGTTMCYAEIAERIGRPKSVRAVANAIGANPISIFIPCHRVIGSNGSLTGYRGGLLAKKLLLNIENKPLWT